MFYILLDLLYQIVQVLPLFCHLDLLQPLGCREKVVNSEVYKAAEQKRFDLIRKSLEEAKASKAEVRSTAALLQQ